MNSQELREEMVRKAVKDGDALQLKAAMEMNETHLKQVVVMLEKDGEELKNG